MQSHPFQLFNWHLEISSKCALRCPRCTRTEMPGSYPVTELSLAFIQKLFPVEFLRQHVKRITFSGGVGDPLYNTQLLEIVRYLKSSHPDFQLVIVTNGSHRPQSFWTELGKSLNHFDELIFSIDGWDQDSNNQYRVNSNFDSIMWGVEEMVKSPAIVRWSTIVFSFNQAQLDKIESLAESKGVDHFHVVLSERFGQRYADPITGVDPLEPIKDFKSAIPRTQRYKKVFQRNPSKLKMASKIEREIRSEFEKAYLKTETQFGQSPIMPTCEFGYRGIYVDVEGRLFPCSWVSHPFKEMQSKLDRTRVLKFSDSLAAKAARFDLNQRDLKQILNDPIWSELRAGWHSLQECYIVCERKCLREHSTRAHLENQSTAKLRPVST